VPDGDPSQPDVSSEPCPNSAWNNTKDFVGGTKDGGVDVGKGMWQLGYDTSTAPSVRGRPNQAETEAAPRPAAQ
jgi:hypothetical protein